MFLAELATVSNYECLMALRVGVVVDLVVRLFFSHFCFFTLMCRWRVLDRP